MGAYKYLEELWKKKQSDVIKFLLRIRMWEYRQLPTIHRCTKPSRPDKARRLGFKKKQGFIIYRIKVRRGSRVRDVHNGRVVGKPKTHGVFQITNARSLRTIAESRIGAKLPELRVLNSYWVGQDSTYKYFEVILVDPFHKAIRRDPHINWICKETMKHRELRGLTASGRSHRGLLVKGHRCNKNRPSMRANWKRRTTMSLKRYR